MTDTGISVIFIVFVLLIGFGITNTLKWARKASWADSSTFRKITLIFGWLTLVIAIGVWLLMLMTAINGLLAMFRPHAPKPHTFYMLFIGTFVYGVLISVSNAAIRGSSGSAREDIYRRIGREP